MMRSGKRWLEAEIEIGEMAEEPGMTLAKWNSVRPTSLRPVELKIRTWLTLSMSMVRLAE